jgi:hypothetical protein
MHVVWIYLPPGLDTLLSIGHMELHVEASEAPLESHQ